MKKKKNKNKFVQRSNVGVRQLTYGDFEDGCVKVMPNEAALIVTDVAKMICTLANPAINPIIVACAGNPDQIKEIRQKYEGNHKFDVLYIPAEEDGQ